MSSLPNRSPLPLAAFAWRRAAVFALLATLGVAGCQCGEDLTRVDDPEPEATEPGLPIVDTPMEPDPPPADPAYTLSRVGEPEVTLFFGHDAELSFLLVDERQEPVPGATVVFALTGDVVTLGAEYAVTDADGLVAVTLSAGALAGAAQVEATSEWVAMNPVVAVTVREDPAADLEVVVDSTTRIGVEDADLFVKVGTPADLTSCASLIGAPADPSFAELLSAVPDSRSFSGVQTGAYVLVVVAGYGPTGDLIATGCAEAGPLVGGELLTVPVTLHQLPTVLEGDYDILMHMALGQLLPEPYESTVDFITGLLADPAGYAVYRALSEMDDETGSSFVHWDVGGGEVLATFDEVRLNPGTFPTWNLARNYMHDQLVAQLGQTYLDITTIGGDLRNAITDFEVGARFSVTDGMEPDALVVHELWNDLVFEWSRGCAEGDLGCSRRAIALENTAYAPVTSEYDALWEHDPQTGETEQFYVRTYPHRLALRYGAILLIVLEELLYPELGADSLAGFFVNLIDCESVGESIADAVGGPAFLYEGFCVTGMTLAAQQIEAQLLSLEVGEGDPELEVDESEGVVGGSWLWLADRDHDLFTEDVPQLEYEVHWVDPDQPELSDEVSAPIAGEGRLAASGCDSDGQCGMGETCQPVPSYLYVAELELDCRRAVGSLLGEEACSADGECASGLCAGGHCYSACADDGACGLGTCQTDGLALDLDSMMSGLGSAYAPACVVP